MKRLAAALASAALLLSACGSTGTTDDPPKAAPPEKADSASSAPAASDKPKTNDRGNIVKKVGEKAGLKNAQGKQTVELTVTKITPGFKCTGEYASPPENGNFIAIDVTMVTSKDFQVSDLLVNSHSWKVIGPDGTTENSSASGASFSCIPENKAIPMTIGPGQSIKGTVILDSQYKSGAVMLPVGFSTGGWEWPF